MDHSNGIAQGGKITHTVNSAATGKKCTNLDKTNDCMDARKIPKEENVSISDQLNFTELAGNTESVGVHSFQEDRRTVDKEDEVNHFVQMKTKNSSRNEKLSENSPQLSLHNKLENMFLDTEESINTRTLSEHDQKIPNTNEVVLLGSDISNLTNQNVTNIKKLQINQIDQTFPKNSTITSDTIGDLKINMLNTQTAPPNTSPSNAPPTSKSEDSSPPHDIPSSACSISHLTEYCPRIEITDCTPNNHTQIKKSICTNSSSHQRQHHFHKTQSLELPFQIPEINIIKSRSLDKQQVPSSISESCESVSDNLHPLFEPIGKEEVLLADTQIENKKSRRLDNTYSSFDASSADKSKDFPICSRSLQKPPSVSSKLQSIDSRPIYPNVPYSPYASPYGSPHSRRRPPFRESRRISIEQSGSFLQLNQYKLLDQIGQGSYGLVKLAYSEEDSTHYAMKILSKRKLLRQAGLMRRGPKKTTSPLDRVYREIAVLKKLDHPNVVKLIEVLDDPVEDSLYMVFELVKQGEVLSIPTEKPLSEERVWSIFRETLLGLEYLHYQRIIHADIKPGNLLLTECGHVKIADLGVCNEFLGEDATMSNGSTAGTPAFRAPETLNLGKLMYCGKSADIWALGATLYSLVFGNVPFIASSIPVLYEKIKNDLLLFPETPEICDRLKDCIRFMLTKDPTKRITLPLLKENIWVTNNELYPLPTEEENCRLVQVSDDDINTVVRSIPKLDTLILIKTMLKKHSFGNPFTKGISGRAPQRGGSRLERFVRAGRSNSAPGAYNMAIDKQLSSDNILPSLSELGSSSNNEE